MSVDEQLARVKDRKMLVSNLYQGTDNLWRCFLRQSRNGKFVKSGIGPSAAEALFDALKLDFDFSDLV